MELLQKLCEIHAPSGDEGNMREFILDYIEENKKNWKTEPVIHTGEGFQNCIVLAFGKPRTAVFAHMDSIGYTAGYDNELLKIGKPVTAEGIRITGKDSKGEVDCITSITGGQKEQVLKADFNRTIDRGTTLTYHMDFRETEDYIQSCYMDNRLGVWNALKLAEDLSDGIIVFSCWEEHGGGSVGYLARFIYREYNVSQALISDITWVTNGIHHGKGVAISLRDSGIPRKSYTDKIVKIAEQSGIDFQLEVEKAGGSDGNALQKAPYPFDWCFIGAPEKNVHSPDETVHKKDIESMNAMYKELMKKL